MTEHPYTPNPLIKIRDEMPYNLPLRFFDLLIFVEPDPETWMIDLVDKDLHAEVWEEILSLVDQEFFWEADDNEKPEYDPNISLSNDVSVLWLRNSSEGPNHYECMTTEFSDVQFSYTSGNSEVPFYFNLFIKALHSQFPDMKVAVFGAIFEDEVIRVANVVQETGLDTTVLTRYCFSNRGFINLDDLLG